MAPELRELHQLLVHWGSQVARGWGQDRVTGAVAERGPGCCGSPSDTEEGKRGWGQKFRRQIQNAVLWSLTHLRIAQGGRRNKYHQQQELWKSGGDSDLRNRRPACHWYISCLLEKTCSPSWQRKRCWHSALLWLQINVHFRDFPTSCDQVSFPSWYSGFWVFIVPNRFIEAIKINMRGNGFVLCKKRRHQRVSNTSRAFIST